MFGALMAGVFLIGCAVTAIKNGSYNFESKNDAINNNQKYYMDWQGDYRRVDNGHRVLRHVKDFKTGDIVDLDMKTNQILRNYSKEERIKEFAEQDAMKRERERAKEEALKNGLIVYESKEPLPDPRGHTVKHHYVTRRTRDDLLVIHNRYRLVDKKCCFIICCYEGYSSVKEVKQRNRQKCKNEYLQKETGMTEEELLAYAKSIGAIL